MNGFEIHSDVIRMAAYAPLMSHEYDVWGPAQLVMFNNKEYASPLSSCQSFNLCAARPVHGVLLLASKI